MGATASVNFTDDSSSHGHSGPAFLRRRTLSLLSSTSSSSSNSISANNSSTSTASTPRIEIVKPHVLSVPIYERHPFSDYKFNKKVGEGSFATVFKGISIHNDKLKVAVKEINVRTLGKQQLHDLNMEMNILSQLHHDSIVKIYAVYSTLDKTFMITEYLPGGELLSAICKRDHYHERDARRVMYQVTTALQYMHARRVIHRDIKPMNLILSDRSLESAVKIADFGFATIDSEEIRRPGRFLCGTPGYIAPEVLKYRCYSPKVDMWSLGIVLYVLLSGYMPFPTDEAGEEHVKRGRVIFPPARFARVSHQAKDLILKLLTVDPESRYSASQVLQHPWLLEYAQLQQRREKKQQHLLQLQEKSAPRRNSNSSVGSTASTCTIATGHQHSSSNNNILDNTTEGEELLAITERRDSNDSGTSLLAYASQQPPHNSFSNTFDQDADDSEIDPYEVYVQNRQAGDFDDGDDYRLQDNEEEDGDLSENLEWIRRYHANEQHPQTFTGRLWRSIRSATSVANPPISSSSSSSSSSNAVVHQHPPGSSSSSSTGLAGRKQQQHQDILLALSERELQRQYEEYQERQQDQQKQSQHQLQSNSAVNSSNRTSHRKTSKDKISDLPPISSKTGDTPDAVVSGNRSRSDSFASVRRPSDVGLEKCSSTDVVTLPEQSESKHKVLSPRLFPPILSSIMTGNNSNLLSSTSEEYSSMNQSSNNNNIAGNNLSKLPRSAQKYGKNGPVAGSSRGHEGNESIYHPPAVLLVYSR